MSHGRFRDRHQAPVKPEVVHYQKGEHHKDRHKRRLEINVEQFSGQAQEWAESHSVFCRISNRGHHWKFQRNGIHVEWWPESAKCVINRDQTNGVHVHEFPQLLVILKREFDVED